MKFDYLPALLTLLLLPILGALWLRGWRQQQRDIAHLGDGVQRYLRPITSGRRRQTWLWFAGLGLLLLSLARPQWGQEIEVVDKSGLQIMMVLDVSRSMWADDVRPNRLARAQQIVRELIPLLDTTDEVGVTLFAGEGRIVLPLTADHDAALPVLAGAGPGYDLPAGTRLGPAIRTAAKGVTVVRSGQPVLLLLTDGEDQASQPVAAAQAAAATGVLIYTIGLGSGDGAPVPLLDEAGRVSGYEQDADGNPVLTWLEAGRLQAIAEAGNGRYFTATAVDRDVATLAQELAAVRASHTGQQPQVRPREQYQPFVLAALLLLVLLELQPLSRRVPVHWLRFGRRRWRLPLMLLLFGPAVWLSGCAAYTGARHVKAGNQAYSQARYPAALAAYQAAQTAVPDAAEPAYNAANVLYRQQEFVLAQRTMEAALSHLDGHPAVAAYFNLGNFYYAAGVFDQAIVAYQATLRRRPDDLDAKHNLELALRQAAGQSEEESERGSSVSPDPDNGDHAAAARHDVAERVGSLPEPVPGRPALDLEGDGRPQPGQETPHPAIPRTTAEAQQLLDAISQNTGTLPQSQRPDASPTPPPAGPGW